MKKYTLIPAALVLAALSACSSGPQPGNYECELKQNAAGKCASMSHAYNASQKVKSADAFNVQSVFEATAAQAAPAAGANRPVVGAQVSGYPDVGEAGMPVFQQPKVMRVWVAPYVDADGNLRSGEYTYFSTPGQWNFGDLKKPGAAAGGMFEPARDTNLGFNPSSKSVGGKATAPAAPAEPARTGTPGAAVSQPQGGGSQSPAATTITQPYQRLAP